MRIKDYAKDAMTTCTDSSFNYNYMFGNLVGEVGEFSSKVQKALRKEQIVITSTGIIVPTEKFSKEEWDEFNKALKLELGDILWQWSGLCAVLGYDPSEVAELNLAKLRDRKKAGTIVGNGDGVSGEERKCD